MAVKTSIPYQLIFFLLAFCSGCIEKNSRYTDWRTYGGNPESNRYSSLNQINKNNVNQLKTAWTYQTGDSGKDNDTQIQCNPIMVDSVLYVTSPRLKVIAIHAATGKEIWVFDPFPEEEVVDVSRGVAYWKNGDDKRILAVAKSNLYALDAKTGKVIASFGDQGKVDLRKGFGKDIGERFITSTTPGIIYKNLLILGSRVSEGADAAPGHIRAFNTITGKVQWIFNTVPQPGEYGYDTWPKNAYKTIGGANSWAGFSLDEETGMVYVPLGSPSFDFYGGNRKGQNLFGNCLLALNATTGKRVWHYQTIHHDIWDRDLPAPPNLVEVEHDGKKIKAVAQITKHGYVFVFDRKTGKPLFPVEEKPAPAGGILPGEEPWPTQPIPLKPAPFARQQFTENDLSNLSASSHAALLKRFREIRSGRQFIPPSKQGTLIFPGFDGGGEWGGAAYDPQSHLLYVNANEMPWILTMINTEQQDNDKNFPGRKAYLTNCSGCHRPDMIGEQHMYPSLVDINKKLSRDEVMTVLNTGKGRMPSFQQLSLQERNQIIDYLFKIPAKQGGARQNIANTKTNSQDQAEIPYVNTGYNRFVDNEGYPAVKPPWGTLNAINLDNGELAWQVPLGEYAELSKKGIPITGTENYGGPVVTAGGLVFIAASKDEKFRAFNKATGKMLWETQLPAGGYATPCTYQVNGKQYVVIAAGGGKMGSKSGDSYVAYALP